MGVEIRRMQPDELEATVDVWVRSRWDARPWLEPRMGYTRAQDLAHFRDVIAVENDVWLAVDGDRVLALMAISDGEIDQFYVDPDAQGRGIGTALLAKAHAAPPGRLGLYTHQRNQRARRFYERRGFVAVAFGVSPAPESEPDVRYEWTPERGKRRAT